MKRSNRIGWAQVRAGIFIFLALIFIAAGVLMMGEKTKMFTPKGKLRVVMDDVAGLKEGAPVWLAGVDVGVVTAVRFVAPETSNQVTIFIEAEHEALRKIGPDSGITIKTRGLLGEKYVDITPSHYYSPTPPAQLRGTVTAKLDDVVQKAGSTFDRVNQIVDSVTQGTGTLGKLANDPQLYANIVRLTSELSALTITINRGEGTLGRLNRDPEPYNRLVSLLGRADQTLREIQQADGTLNSMIHDKSLYTRLVELADVGVKAAGDVRELNSRLTSSNGTLGMLINDRGVYDRSLSLLTRADNSVRAMEEITGRIREGNGTLGKVINEKELYERLNRMVDSVDLLVRDVRQNPGRYVKFSLF